MEINLKINLPLESDPKNPGPKPKIPKSLKISYYLDFDNNNNSNDNNSINENVQNSNSNKIYVDLKNCGNILTNKNTHNAINLNLKNINGNKLDVIDKNNKDIINISKDKEENDKRSNLSKKDNTNRNSNNNDDVWESSNNRFKKEKDTKYNNNNNNNSRGQSLSNMHSKRSYENKSNRFGSYGKGTTGGRFNNSNDKIDIPTDAKEELFVTGVREFMGEKDLMETFKKYGEIVLIKILKDKLTQKNKGVAFVKFKQIKSAFMAMMDADNIICKGKNLKIKYNNKIRKNKGKKDFGDNNNDNDNVYSMKDFSNFSNSFMSNDDKVSNYNSNKSCHDDNVSHYSHSKRERSRDKKKDDDDW